MKFVTKPINYCVDVWHMTSNWHSSSLSGYAAFIVDIGHGMLMGQFGKYSGRSWYMNRILGPCDIQLKKAKSDNYIYENTCDLIKNLKQKCTHIKRMQC